MHNKAFWGLNRYFRKWRKLWMWVSILVTNERSVAKTLKRIMSVFSFSFKRSNNTTTLSHFRGTFNLTKSTKEYLLTYPILIVKMHHLIINFWHLESHVQGKFWFKSWVSSEFLDFQRSEMHFWPENKIWMGSKGNASERLYDRS